MFLHVKCKWFGLGLRWFGLGTLSLNWTSFDFVHLESDNFEKILNINIK